MADCQITCITKPHPLSSHEHITHVGNPAANWEWTRERVIASIEDKTNTFFVLDSKTGKRSEVGVVYPNGRAPYLRTHADGYWNDNLLALGQCPLASRRKLLGPVVPDVGNSGRALLRFSSRVVVTSI